jgi:hypothetical protein
MLSVKQYSNEYINICRKKVKADIEVFKKIPSVTETFEKVFFNNMVLVLETMFMHRMRAQEGKDGNPLNEVRMISNSILTNDNKLEADNTIKYNDAKSILKIKLGQEISLTAKDFVQLSDAYFDDIGMKFSGVASHS